MAEKILSYEKLPIPKHLMQNLKEMYRTMINSLNEESGAPHTCQYQGYSCNFCQNMFTKQYDAGFETYWEDCHLRCSCDKSSKYWEVYDAEVKIIKEKMYQIAVKTLQDYLYQNSLLGKRFFNRTFDAFEICSPESKKAYDKCLNYANNFKDFLQEGAGLLITGNSNVGTGKTHLAASIANYLMTEKFIEVRFINVVNLFCSIKDTYKHSSTSSEKDVVDELSTVSLLILDDLGKENITEWSKSLIYNIINNRYEANKPIIITTEWSVGNLKDIYSKALQSRLIEMCSGVILTGKDYRMRKLDNKES